MSYIDKNLIADEHIVYRTKKSWIIFFLPGLWLLAALICAVNSNQLVVKLSFLPFAAAIFTGLNQWLIYRTSDYAVTNKRIMMKEGFFVRRSNETRLSSISNVSTSQSLLGQFFNYGAVFINVFGGDIDSFTDIDSPSEFKRQVQQQLDNTQKTNAAEKK